MTLSRIRCGVRIAAGSIGVVSALGGGIVYRAGDADIRAVLDGLTFVLVVTGFWIIAEAIVAGFEEIQRITKARYERLQTEQATAHAIAGQAVCETIRALTEQALEDAPNVRLMHR